MPKFVNIKLSHGHVAAAEINNTTGARLEQSNTLDAEENNLNNKFMKLIKALKWEMKNYLKIKENVNQKFKTSINPLSQEKHKQVQEMVQDMKVGMEIIKVMQSNGILEMKNLSKQAETTDASIKS